MVSEIAGTFFRSICRSSWMKATSWRRSSGGISGTRAWMMRCSRSMSGNGMYRCRQRRLRASEISRVLFEVRNTIGGSFVAFTVPISGIDTWKSDRISSSSDSNSWSDLSTSSISRIEPFSSFSAFSSGRGSRNSSEKKMSPNSCSRLIDSVKPFAPCSTSSRVSLSTWV